jgi:selenocysteine lyase/cysteine desulfurase
MDDQNQGLDTFKAFKSSKKGTVRGSQGFFNTTKEIEFFFEVIKKSAKKI